MRAVLSTVPNPDDDDGARWIETVAQYATASASFSCHFELGEKSTPSDSLPPFQTDPLPTFSSRLHRNGGVSARVTRVGRRMTRARRLRRASRSLQVGSDDQR